MGSSLSTRGSKKMNNTMGTPACTFKQIWDNVPQAMNPDINVIKQSSTLLGQGYQYFTELEYLK